MARESRGLCTTRCQLFNDEITKTEDKLRMKWFAKNRQLLLDNLRDDKLARRAEQIRGKHEEQRLRRQKEKIIEDAKPLPSWRPRESDGKINLDIMRPIDPSVRAVLHESGVESYATANNYLRERYKDKPENRYYYLDCTSWLHAWRLADYPPVPAAKFGKSSIIRDTFYRRNGASLKPGHSDRSCQLTNAKNFDIS